MKTHGFSKKMTYTWWVLHIYLSSERAYLRLCSGYTTQTYQAGSRPGHGVTEFQGVQPRGERKWWGWAAGALKDERTWDMHPIHIYVYIDRYNIYIYIMDTVYTYIYIYCILCVCLHEYMYYACICTYCMYTYIYIYIHYTWTYTHKDYISIQMEAYSNRTSYYIYIYVYGKHGRHGSNGNILYLCICLIVCDILRDTIWMRSNWNTI